MWIGCKQTMKDGKHLYPFTYVPWRLLGVLLCIDLAVIVFIMTRPAAFFTVGQPQAGLYMPGLISVIGPLVSAILCLWGSFRWLQKNEAAEGVRQTRRFSPLLWGLSGFVYTAGQVVWLGQISVTGLMPSYPGLGHLLGLLTYPCFIGAILLLPSHSLAPLARLRILLDSLIIMAAVATLCYYFVLAPLLVTGRGTQLAKTIGGLYPALDLLAMLSVLLVALRSGERILRPVLIMLGLATIVQFSVNVLHLTEVLYRDYNELAPAGVLMVFYGTLLAVAAQTINAIERAERAPELSAARRNDALAPRTLWKRVLPSALALVFGLLVFLIWLDGGQTFPGQIFIVYIGGFAVLILMLLRQIVTMYQIGGLQEKLQQKNRSLDLLNMQLERQATTDPLTGLANHRALAEQLDEFLGRADARGTACSLIFMDIDHFKDINDYYGHLTGDVVLRQFAGIVTATVRAGDSIGRWGGEEFVAILPATPLEEACQVAERIRQATLHSPASCGPGISLTCSLGVAAYPQDAHGREELIRLADQAMYMAKRLGRNQVRTAREAVELEQREAVQVHEGCTEGCVPVVEALQALVEVRDPPLGQHVYRVAELSRKLALELGLSQEEAYTVYLGGRLHDLGNIAMPDELLRRHVPWSKENLESLARYQTIGAEILEPVPALRSVALIIRTNHEWVDGSGYPRGLKGEEIPLGARIVAVASAYDIALMAQSRRGARASALAFKEISRHAGSRFDRRVIEALRRVLALAPGKTRVDVA